MSIGVITVEILITIALTLLIYSAISCAVFEITKENETVAIYFGLGIIGMSIVAVAMTIKKIKKLKVRSISECPDGIVRYCKTIESEYVEYLEGYKILKRYANIKEWKHLEKIKNDAISEGKILFDKDYSD